MINSNSARFRNTSRNMLYALLAQMITVGCNLLSRAVFVRMLDAEYMGISGLFTNILGLLSLAELGVGSAISYSLYKPIKDSDEDRIKSLMRLYKHLYWVISGIILIVGLCLTPFIERFIKESPSVPHLKLIFILFVVQSASSYLFSYKAQFLTVSQNDYIYQKIRILFITAQTILQILYLFVYKEYFGYLLIGIGFSFLCNVFASAVVDRLFPFLRGAAHPLSKSELAPIKKNVFALFIYKIAQKLSATIDTLIVSKFMGIIEVAIYYNYHFILAFADVFFIQILGSITPSLGNFIAGGNKNKEHSLFKTIQLLYYWIGTYMGVGFIVLFNTFIRIWLGNEFLFPQSIVIALAISSTITNFQRPCSLVRDAGGLFWYGKLRPVASTLINIVSSLLFVHWLGTIGVVIGTIISKVTTYVWYDPYVVFKHEIKGSLKNYYLTYLVNWVVFILLAILCYYMYNATGLVGSLPGLFIGFLIVTIVVNGTFFLIYNKTEEFSYLKANLTRLYLSYKAK